MGSEKDGLGWNRVEISRETWVPELELGAESEEHQEPAASPSKEVGSGAAKWSHKPSLYFMCSLVQTNQQPSQKLKIRRQLTEAAGCNLPALDSPSVQNPKDIDTNDNSRPQFP